MATDKKTINKEAASAYSKAKKYVYSWLTDGEGTTDYIISDRLSALNFDVGIDASIAGATTADHISLVDGNSASYLKSVAAGYVQISKNTSGSQTTEKTYNFVAPKALSVSGVDVGTVYGGAIITTNINYTSIYATNSSRYENVDAVVEGGSNISITGVKATAVYGGGAGYGSVLNGDVSIKLTGTNTISNVYGGGQKGAVVNGDIYIDLDRRDATGGRIGTIYGGGDNATVNGDVNITVHGTNAISVGTISGSGKGTKAKVNGTRTLTIADYSGKFSTTIKDFDKIIISSGTAITLTQSQNKTIQSAEYQFVIDEASVNQSNAMLTWNKTIDTGKFYVTIDSDFAANVDDAFTTTIYSNSTLTEAQFNKSSMKVYDEAGNEITSGYTLSFVADVDNNGKEKKKGGSVVLSYVGSKSELTADSEDTELTDAANKVSIKGDLVRASLDTKGGDDRVTVQTQTLMAGDIYLGTGNNTLNVQSDAEVTGSVIVDKNSTNTININGTIAQIEGGDETTNNIVNINSEYAVGYWNNKASEYGDKWAGDREGYDIDSTGREAQFVQQDLNFTSGSNDKVVVSTSSAYQGNINFAKGTDTLVLNADQAGTITAEDGNDMIVANKTGITLDASTLKLSGTDNVFVASNGVYATINNAGAIGNFESKYAGLYLSQNAMINVNGTLATMSFDGDIDLTTLGGGSDLTILQVAENLDRVSEYYTAGTGVNADINADGQNIELRDGAVLNGTVYAGDNGTALLFSGTAGGKIYFDNDDVNTNIRVAKNQVATVGAIDGISGTTYAGKDDFDGDLANVTLFQDAAVYEADSKDLIVGNITKDVTDFATSYGIKDGISQITVIDEVNANVTFTDANVYAAGNNDVKFAGDINFAGKNTIAVKTNGLVLDNEQMKFADGATAAFNVKEGGLLVFDGIKAGESYNSAITVDFSKNARFAYGDTMKTASWSEDFTSDMLEDGNGNLVRTNVEFVKDSLIDGKIDLSGTATDLNVEIADGVEVKGHLTVEDAASIKLGKGDDTLTVGKATVNGQINLASKVLGLIAVDDKDTLTLNGSTINAMTAPKIDTAIVMDDADTLEMTDGALVNGDIEGGKHLHITESEVKGSINGATNVLVNATVGSLKGNTTLVERKSADVKVEDAVSNIGTIDVTEANVTLKADAATANIGTVNGLKEDEDYDASAAYNAVSVEARNGAQVNFTDGIQTVVGGADISAVHNGSAVNFNGDVKLVTKGDVTLAAKAGGELTGMGDITISGGVDTNGDAVAAMDEIVTKLAGKLGVANSVTISSEVTDKWDAEADETKTISNLKAGDVNLIAKTSTISMASEGSVNEFGAIRQSGKIEQSGYPINDKVDATQTYTKFGNAVAATVEVTETASFKADSITQYATTAKVAFDGTAEVTNGIVQGAELDNKNGIDETKAGTAEVTFNGKSTTLTTSSISQYANTSATVDAAVKVTQSYTSTNLVDEPLEAKEFDKLSSVITGTIDQKSADNDVLLGVDLYANGKYDTDTTGTLINSDLHKDAVIKVGEIEASYGSVTQEGASNYLDATLRTGVTGEADITVGKATLKMGDVTQTSNVEGTGAWANSLSVITWAYTDDYGNGGQAKTTLEGEVTGTVGAIKQTAFKNNNYVWLNSGHYSELEDVEENDAIQEGKSYSEIIGDVNKITLTVASVNMLAYGGENELWLQGNTTVTNDVTVGGVLSGEEYVDYAYGDRTATENAVDITVDTVKIGGNVALIGLKNVLTLNNESRTEGVTVNAKNVYVAGDDNTVDIDYGVTMNKITLTGLADADKIGQEGYDLGAAAKANTLIVRGTLEGVSISHKGSNDTFNVYGGTIKGDIDTKNGNDTINVTGDATAGKATTTYESKIEGNVTMGLKNDLANDVLAEGDNTVSVKSFQVFEDETGAKQVGVGEAKITGDVKMYAGAGDAANGDNELIVRGKAFTDADTQKVSFARASIGGSVAMEAVTYKENAAGDGYEVDKTKGNNTVKLSGATIAGDVAMAAFLSNTVKLGQEGGEEYVYPEALGGSIDKTTHIGGKLSMTGDQNTVKVNAFSGNYVNGITMDQSYVGADGITYSTSATGTNTVTVGDPTKNQGAELLVGTYDAETKTTKAADVNMGALYVEDVNTTTTVTKGARLVADAGHDAINYSADTTENQVVAAQLNTIDVTGRFTANDVNMVANSNAINVVGDGTLGKTAKDANGDYLATEAARTAVFTANDITQKGETWNSISVIGDNDVEHYLVDADGNYVLDDAGKKIVDKYLEVVQFTAGKITQERLDIDATTLTYNDIYIEHDDHYALVAKTGAIEQSGNYKNNVSIEGTRTQVSAEFDPYVVFSEVNGGIKQTSNVTDETTINDESWINGVDLNGVNVTGDIVQTVADNVGGNWAYVDGVYRGFQYKDVGIDATHDYGKVYAATLTGNITETGAFNYVENYESTVTGTIGQIATRGVKTDGTLLDETTNDNRVTNYIWLSSYMTDAAKLTTAAADGLTDSCDAAGCPVADANHNAESVYADAQGEFNTQTVGAISQSFDNTLDAAHQTDTVMAKNTARLRDVNVGTVAADGTFTAGTVTQTGKGYVSNTFDLSARDYNGKETITKMATYVGENDSAEQPVNKVGEYQDIQTVKAGAIAQEGTVNSVDLTSANAGAIEQKSLEDKSNVGGNTVTLNNLGAVTEAFVNVMTLEGGVETLTRAQLEGSANKYVKSSTGDIKQTSNVQKNYATTEINSVRGTAAADTGAITQGLADGTTAKFANVRNVFSLLANTVAYKTLKDVDGNTLKTEAGYDKQVISTVTGDIAQAGAQNAASVYGTISGKVDQTANLIQTEDEHGKATAQSVNTLANRLAVYGVKEAEAEGTMLDAEGKDKTVIVQNESIIKGSVGNVTQTVNDALALKTLDGKTNADLTTVTGINTISLDTADFGDVKQTANFGGNMIYVTNNNQYANTTKEQLKGGAIDQTGTANTITLADVDATGKTVTQTATTLTNFDETTWAKASNELKTTGYVSTVELSELKAGETQKVVTQPIAVYTKLGDVTQTATDVSREITTKIGDAEAVTAEYYDNNLDDEGKNNPAKNAMNLESTTAGNIVQTAVGYGANEFTFNDLGRQVWQENEKAAATPKETVYENTLGTLTQTGTDNIAKIGNGKSVGNIVQDADAVKIWNNGLGANYTSVGAYVGNNDVELVGGEVTVGNITQTLDNGKADSITKETGKDDVLMKANDATTGDNIVNAEGKLSDQATVLTGPTDKDGKLVAPDKDHPNTWVNQEFLSSIGDVTQTVSGVAARDKATDDSAILAAQVLNTVTLKNIDAGVVTQTATGYATNKFESTENVVLDHYTMGTDGYTAVKGEEFATVEKIDQEGFVNEVDAKNLKVGDISLGAKKVAYTAEVEEGGKKVEKTLQSYGSNTITLDNVDAQKITAVTDSDVGEVKIGGVMKTVITLAGRAEVDLENGSTATGIMTGSGSDEIDLGWNKTGVDKVKVTGTIDMGSERYETDGTLFKQGDVLNVDTDDVDLTAASIDNVEVFNAKNGVDNLSTVIIQAKSIDAEAINNVSGSGKGRIEASNIEVKSTSGFGTFQGLNAEGTKDTLTLEGTLGTTTVKDFDEVTFASGATGTNITWVDEAGKSSATQGTIKFDLTNVISEDDPETGAKENTFVLGSFTDTYGKSDVTFEYDDKDYTYQTSGVYAGSWTNADDTTHKFTYSSGSGTVTYANV